MARGTLQENQRGYDSDADDRLNPALQPKRDGSSAGGGRSDQTDADLRSVVDGERNPSSGDHSALNSAESGLSRSAGKVGKGFTGAAAGGKLGGVAKLLKNRKAIGGAAGGGGIAGVLIGLLIATSSLGVINITDTLDGDANISELTTSQSLEERRVTSFQKIIRAGVKDQAQVKLTDIVEADFTAKGWAVVRDRTSIRTMSYGQGPDKVIIDFTTGSDKNVANQFAKLSNGNPAQRAALQSWDSVYPEKASRFSGFVQRRKVLQKIGITRFFDWIRGATTTTEDADGNPRRSLARARSEREVIDRKIDNIIDEDVAARMGTDAEGSPRVGPDGNPIDVDVNNLGDEVNKGADDLKKAYEDADYNGRINVGDEALNDANQLNSGGTGKFFKNGVNNTEAAASKLGGKIGKGFLTALSAIDIGAPARVACDTKGQIQFVRRVRNTLMAAELAQFWFNYKTIADHQKAGLIEESSIKLMSLYVAGATGSSGFQNVLSKGRIPVATTAISKYGIGYADVGVLALIAEFIESIPAISSENCAVIQSAAGQATGMIIGGLLTVASGGSITGVNIGLSISLTVGYEIAKTIATPILMRAAAGFVVDFYENNIDAGDALTAASGAARAMSSNGQAALPTSNDVFSAQAFQAEQIYQERVAKRNFYDKYLNVAQVDSLASRVAFMLPRTPAQTSDDVRSFALNPLSNVGSVAKTISGSRQNTAYASNECEDSAAVKYNIATDPFCNVLFTTAPVLNLDQTEEILREEGYIDGAGQPFDEEYIEFEENCFSGRNGVLHPIEVNKDGSTPDDDPTCVIGIDDEPISGDVAEYFPGIEVNDDRNWLAKIVSPRAYAQSVEGTTRVPTKKERFASWSGYLVDRENYIQQIERDYGLQGETQTEDPTNTNILFLGDSLTVGMQDLAGTDEQETYLERRFEESGWADAAVNAQGCRAVFQTVGPLEDVDGCPAGTVIDGIDAATNEAFLDDSNAGTVVIGLGTNAYELDAEGQVDIDLFRTKASELLATIRQKSLGANIYWVNLTSSSGPTTNQAERNIILRDLAATQGFTLLDWKSYVENAASTPDAADDATFADADHHDAAGYRIKVQYLLNNIALPEGAGPVSVDCSGYEVVSSPTTREQESYSADIIAKCEELKTRCESGAATGTEAVICSAFDYDGVFYGNSFGSYAGDAAKAIYGFSASSSNYGSASPVSWLENRSEGLSPNNLLECSGLTGVALYDAYGTTGVGCSGNWTERNRPDLFRQLTAEEIRPGDFLTKSFSCGGTVGHIAIAASEVDANGDIIVYETNEWKKPVRFTKKNLTRDFGGGWSRYIGETVATE